MLVQAANDELLAIGIKVCLVNVLLEYYVHPTVLNCCVVTVVIQSTAYFNPTVAHTYEIFYDFCAANNFFLTKENGLPYNFTYFTGRSV